MVGRLEISDVYVDFHNNFQKVYLTFHEQQECVYDFPSLSLDTCASVDASEIVFK